MAQKWYKDLDTNSNEDDQNNESDTTKKLLDSTNEYYVGTFDSSVYPVFDKKFEIEQNGLTIEKVC